LLSIGEEPSKGSAVTKKAHALLQESSLNFIGNVEGKEIPMGAVDVVVCDGFVGNVVLKTVEGYAELFVGLMKEQLLSGWRHRLGAWLLKPGLRSIARRFNYAAHGGALLVGVNGVCVIAHGRSSPEAIESAIRVARDLATQGVVSELAASFQQTTVVAPESTPGEGEE
jgi:glycerol-3-phosphate acyltransferase PlsX